MIKNDDRFFCIVSPFLLIVYQGVLIFTCLILHVWGD